jgi:hypothetical protein
MTLFNGYGIIIGIVSIVLGIVSMLWSRIVMAMTGDSSASTEVKPQGIVLGVFLIVGGLLSISAVVLGWPPVRGSIVPFH